MKFSIVTVTLDNLNALKATHGSLENQTCRDFEWIVVDGASTDATTAYLAQTDATWISEPDRGIYDAMNKGLARASGDYILFLNAGDRLASPDVLKKIKDAARDEDFIYGDALEGARYKRARDHSKILTGMITHHQAMFYRRAALGDLRYDTGYKIAADYKLTCLFIRKATSTLYCPIPLCDFEPGGLSQQRAHDGRTEQYAIRQELGLCSKPVNLGIMALQTGLMTIRRLFPGLYWSIKKCRI